MPTMAKCQYSLCLVNDQMAPHGHGYACVARQADQRTINRIGVCPATSVLISNVCIFSYLRVDCLQNDYTFLLPMNHVANLQLHIIGLNDVG